MTKRKLLSVLLAIAMLTSALSFSAKADSSNNQIVTDQQIIQAAQALINAEAQYYDISSITVQNIIETPQADATTNLQCNLVFRVRLKAKSVEELPYVAGLLNGIGMASLNECLVFEEAASQAVARTATLGVSGASMKVP